MQAKGKKSAVTEDKSTRQKKIANNNHNMRVLEYKIIKIYLPQNLMPKQKFCKRNCISESTYYQLRKNGLAPDEVRVGARVLISFDAERRWLRKMQARARENT